MQTLSRCILAARHLKFSLKPMPMAATVLMILASASPSVAQILPADAQSTCTVSTGVAHNRSDAAEFARWFHSGTVTANGLVDPANSVLFPNVPNCSFYQWAERMFMWVTSPSPTTPGRIFDSPIFFEISPTDANGKRKFIPHVAGTSTMMHLRLEKFGPHGLPVIFDTSGHMLEVQKPPLAPNGKQLMLNQAGQRVEIERATMENGQPFFWDKSGKPIEGARPIPQAQLKGGPAVQALPTTNIVQEIMVGQTPVFMTLSGKRVDVEQGEATTDGVLEAQNGSLVYYVTLTNDVYAYFATREKLLNLQDPFPTTEEELNKIKSFASAHGTTLSDPDALAIELKSAWVEAAGLPDRNDYITMTATIPTYDRSNPKKWKFNGHKTAELALVGIHVVGSTAGHPEMIWATFEHLNNAPLASYTYNSTSGQKTVPQDTAGPWLFSSNHPSSFNEMHMQTSGPDIVAVSPHTISPSDTIRWKAWGGASDLAPNPIDGSPPSPTTAASDTEIISINNNVRGMMASGDIRNNYIMTGATWTAGGVAPLPFGENPTPNDPGNQVGTSQLANTTMETYQQGQNTRAKGGSNCLSCHVSNPSANGVATSISHVFPELSPLEFPVPPINACKQSCQNSDNLCVQGCNTARDNCMKGNPPPLDPKICVAQFKVCNSMCSTEFTSCSAKCK